MKKKTFKRSLLIEKAGAFSIVLECLSPNSAKLITKITKYTNYWHRIIFHIVMDKY